MYLQDLRHFTQPFNVTPSQSVDSVLAAQLSAAMHGTTPVNCVVTGIANNEAATSKGAVSVSCDEPLASLVNGSVADLDGTLVEDGRTNFGDKDETIHESVRDTDSVTPAAAALLADSASMNSNESVDSGSVGDVSGNGGGHSVSRKEDADDAALRQQAYLSASDASLTRQLEEQVPVSAISDELASSQLSLSSDNR